MGLISRLKRLWELSSTLETPNYIRTDPHTVTVTYEAVRKPVGQAQSLEDKPNPLDIFDEEQQP